MNYYRCMEDGSPVPRVGCGCRECYLTRETSLDPRLLEMGYGHGSSKVKISREVIRDILMRYLEGRIDYGALHIGIITALAKRLDHQVEMSVEMVGRLPIHIPVLKP